MALRIPVLVSVSLLALLHFAAQAQAPGVNGDAKRGQALTYTCNGCHAIPNYKNVYPTYSVPKLHGQRPEYLVAALKAYKSGERSHGTMHSQATSMSEQDMADVAAFLAGPRRADAVEERRAGRPAPEGHAKSAWPATARTASASRPTTRPSPASTRLPRARAHRLPEGRPQERHHGGHDRVAHAKATSKQLAAYYASQKPALEIVPKKTSFLSSN